jgi:hypothetical protein
MNAATGRFTKRSAAHVIDGYLDALGVAFTHDGPGYVIAGETLTPGQAAERYVPGGWAAVWAARSVQS